MAISPAALAQNKFLMNGGGYELALAQLREKGILSEHYEYHEYPKALRISHGTEEVVTDVETCNKGVYVRSVVPREIFEDIIVNSEEEEERVLAGGKTSVQIKDEHKGLLARCHAMGVPVDPSWSSVRLRRLLGDALDAPAPGDSMAKLEAELSGLRKMKAMQDEIDALRAQIDGRPTPVSDEPIEELGETKRRGKAA